MKSANGNDCDPMTDPKTGRFAIKTQIPLGWPEAEKQALRRRLWTELAGRVAYSMRDGRAYAVLCTGVECADEQELEQVYVFDFTLLLYVANACEAEVGEWVWNLSAA